MNKVILIGRTTKDAELRYTSSGVAVATFTLAVDRPYTKDGNKETDFINVVAWRKLAEICAEYLRKGKLTAVEGSMQIRSYENKEGKKVYVTEVLAENVRFLESNKTTEQPKQNEQSKRDPFYDDGKPIDISVDDLPF